MTALEPAELQKRAKKKARQYRRKRRDPRFTRVMGRLVAAGYLRTNIAEVEAYRGKIALEDALWAGTLEPRIYELLPAIVIKKPGFFDGAGDLPEDLAAVVRAIRRGRATEEFRGIPARDYLAWVPRVGHRNKQPTLAKTFRFRQQDVELLRRLADALGASEPDVIIRGLRSLARFTNSQSTNPSTDGQGAAKVIA